MTTYSIARLRSPRNWTQEIIATRATIDTIGFCTDRFWEGMRSGLERTRASVFADPEPRRYGFLVCTHRPTLATVDQLLDWQDKFTLSRVDVALDFLLAPGLKYELLRWMEAHIWLRRKGRAVGWPKHLNDGVYFTPKKAARGLVAYTNDMRPMFKQQDATSSPARAITRIRVAPKRSSPLQPAFAASASFPAENLLRLEMRLRSARTLRAQGVDLASLPFLDPRSMFLRNLAMATYRARFLQQNSENHALRQMLVHHLIDRRWLLFQPLLSFVPIPSALTWR